MKRAWAWVVAGVAVTGTALAEDAPSSRGKIAFVADGKISIMDADGSNVTTLTGEERRDSFPTWSPDGTRIAFASGSMPSDIWVMSADGSGAKNLTAIKGFRGFRKSAGQPAWSPDGKKIAYALGEMLQSDICVMDADGANPKNLADEKSNDHSPAWSPDGSTIAYVSQDSVDLGGGARGLSQEDIRVVKADGSGKRRLTETEGTEVDPVWSPDGKRFLFTAQLVKEKKGNVTILDGREIWIAAADGSGPQNISKNAVGDDWWPSWSPDGKKIAFAARKEGSPSSIYVMAPDGSEVKALLEPKWGPEYHRVRWSPDGSKLLAVDGRDQIVVLSADGSGLTNVQKGQSPCWSPTR